MYNVDGERHTMPWVTSTFIRTCLDFMTALQQTSHDCGDTHGYPGFLSACHDLKLGCWRYYLWTLFLVSASLGFEAVSIVDFNFLVLVILYIHCNSHNKFTFGSRRLGRHPSCCVPVRTVAIQQDIETLPVVYITCTICHAYRIRDRSYVTLGHEHIVGRSCVVCNHHFHYERAHVQAADKAVQTRHHYYESKSKSKSKK